MAKTPPAWIMAHTPIPEKAHTTLRALSDRGIRKVALAMETLTREQMIQLLFIEMTERPTIRPFVIAKLMGRVLAMDARQQREALFACLPKDIVARVKVAQRSPA